MDWTFESREDFLLVTATGKVSFQETVDACRAFCVEAAERGLRKVLFDCSLVEGDLSVTERFVAGKTIVEFCAIRSIAVKVALVGAPPTVTGLGAKVASNRGMLAGAFTDRQKAMDWLNGVGPTFSGHGRLTSSF